MRAACFAVPLACALAGPFAAPAAVAQSADAAKSIAARVELHAIPSLTLTDLQFLSGDAGGAAVTVTGELRVAQGSGRLPVVVLVHGSGGMGPNIEMWSRELNALGVSTLALDGFTGRGLTSVNTDQARLGRLAFTLDAYRALEMLAKPPRVDPARIILMGFSRGGQGTLFASLKRFHQMWNKSGAEFAAYIPFYPDCSTRYVADTEIDKPIRIFHGAPDDYNPVATCRKYVERLRAASRDVVLTEYPNAQHGFDNPLGTAAPLEVKGAQTVRHCTIVEEPKGVLINAATKQPFSYKDACVELNPHVNHDAEATAAAKIAVKAFVQKTFKLE
jgi:dienelactone hydrolase